jgi:hypothetical protein
VSQVGLTTRISHWLRLTYRHGAANRGAVRLMNRVVDRGQYCVFEMHVGHGGSLSIDLRRHCRADFYCLFSISAFRRFARRIACTRCRCVTRCEHFCTTAGVQEIGTRCKPATRLWPGVCPSSMTGGDVTSARDAQAAGWRNPMTSQGIYQELEPMR